MDLDTKMDVDMKMNVDMKMDTDVDDSIPVINTTKSKTLLLREFYYLEKDGLKMRVVNMTENKLFDAQTPEYKKEILVSGQQIKIN
jgi:transketolase